MTKKQLISMIDEMIFDYEVTGGIMPNTLEKAKLIIDYDKICHCKSSNVTNRICNRCKKIVNYKLSK